MSAKEELLKRMSDGVVDMEEEDVAEAAQEFIDAGYPALEGIMEGLIDGMNRTSVLFDRGRIFCDGCAPLLRCHVRRAECFEAISAGGGSGDEEKSSHRCSRRRYPRYRKESGQDHDGDGRVRDD